jgi:hypothetical protein
MIREERNHALLGYASQMDEEGPKGWTNKV